MFDVRAYSWRMFSHRYADAQTAFHPACCVSVDFPTIVAFLKEISISCVFRIRFSSSGGTMRSSDTEGKREGLLLIIENWELGAWFTLCGRCFALSPVGLPNDSSFIGAPEGI